MKKNRLNRLKFLKTDRFGSVRFWFYKYETEKTKPEKNRAKTKKSSQTSFCPKKLNRNWSV